MTNGAKAFSLPRFRRALKHFVAGRVAQALAMVGFTLVAVRLFPAPEFAAYMLAFGLVEAGRPLVSLGLVPVLQQFLPELALHGTPADLRRLARVAMGLRLLLTAAFASACYFGWTTLLGWLGHATAVEIPAVLVCAVLAASLMADYSATVLETLMQQRSAQPLRTTLPVGKLIALVTLATLGQLSLSHLLWAELVLALCCALVGLALTSRTLNALRPDGSRNPDWPGMMAFGWHLSAAQFLATAANPGVVRMAAARVLGVEPFAYFAFLQQIALHVTRFMPSTQFANVLRPMLVARQAMGQTDTVNSVFNFLWKINLTVGLGIVGAAIAGADDLATWVFGRPQDYAGAALTCMLLLPLFVSKENLASTLLQIHRQSNKVRTLNLMALAVPALVLSGGLAGGLVGAVLGLVLGVGAQALVTLFVVQGVTGLSLDLNGAMRSLGAAGLAALISVLLHMLSPWGGSMQGLAFALVSLTCNFAMLMLLRPFSPSDHELIRRVLPSAARFASFFTRAPH